MLLSAPLLQTASDIYLFWTVLNFWLCYRKQNVAPHAAATAETSQSWGGSPAEPDFSPSPQAGVAARAEMFELKSRALADVLYKKQDDLHQMPS